MKTNQKTIDKDRSLINQTSTKNPIKSNQTSIQNLDRKSTKNRSKTKENRCLEGVWAESSSQARFGRRLGRCLCDSGANMGPTWDPTWRQVGTKIVQKSMSNSIKKLKPLGGFEEAKWNQVGTKMGSNMELILRTAKIKKNNKKQWILMIFEVPRVPKSMNNRWKIDQNVKPKLECLLTSIFRRFWKVWGGKLGRKTEPRSIKKRSKTASKNHE